MTPNELTVLRRAYGEICRGYSETTWRGNPVFVAHLTVFDQTDIDGVQMAAFNEAVARGIKTEEQQLKWLDANKVWTSADEKGLTNERIYVENLHKTHAKMPLKVQRDQIMKQIKEGETKLASLNHRRTRALNLTAERVAEQKVQYEYIRLSFYKDPEMEEPLFTREALRTLDDDESEDLLISYVEVADRFSIDNVRCIAVQPFFSNQFHLCGKAIHTFFDVPIIDLTLHQTNLLLYGQYYRDVFAQYKVPKHLIDDPNKIDEYLTQSESTKAMIAKASQQQEGGRVGIVGGTAEDMKMAGVEDSTAQMHQFAKKGYRDARDAAKDMGYTAVDPKR